MATRARLLGFGAGEHPVALQLGGSEPAEVAAAARVGQDLGYDEINLNVGCPSDRVQSGRFGACLMREPERVADCMAAAIAAVSHPRHRQVPASASTTRSRRRPCSAWSTCAPRPGVKTFVVHARKAWLEGLSPKENRDIPPLDYGLVHRLKAERPHTVHRHQRRAEVAGGGWGAHRSRLGGPGPGRRHARPRRLPRAGDPGPCRPLAVRSGRAGGRAGGRGARLSAYLAAELARGTHLYAMVRHTCSACSTAALAPAPGGASSRSRGSSPRCRPC
ncbi:MAG: tRNA-dihydrouridine synthase [Caulobacteraceae bacterium]